MTPETRRTDVLVVGTGVAGLAAGLYSRGRQVLMVTKSDQLESGSSPRAQGGVAVAVGADDSPSCHLEDSLRAGAGLSRRDVAASITGEGPSRIAELLALGLRLDRDPTGGLELAREGAHSRRRVVHAAGDSTGAELVRALARAVRAAPWIEFQDRLFVLDLITHHGRVVGVDAIDRNGRAVRILATAVVLANGGVGQLFSATTNSVEATGDGLAMAARAGVTLANLEMVQFHPTALVGASQAESSRIGGREPMPLITEALRGEGATLHDRTGRRFMREVHGRAELAPRDVVARAIWRRRQEGDEVTLDATLLADRIDERFPTVVRLCSERGLDPRLMPIPVAPAAHYHMGGVVTDLEGRTSIPGLWACGEVASTGLHGANRLASNSLLEAVVMGARVGEALDREAALTVLPVIPAPEPGTRGSPWLETDTTASSLARRLRETMWSGAGLERTASGLREGLDEAEELRRSSIAQRIPKGELANMILVGRLVLRAAMARTESRGAHHRADFPYPSPCWRQDLLIDGETLRPPRPVSVDRAATG